MAWCDCNKLECLLEVGNVAFYLLIRPTVDRIGRHKNLQASAEEQAHLRRQLTAEASLTTTDSMDESRLAGYSHNTVLR